MRPPTAPQTPSRPSRPERRAFAAWVPERHTQRERQTERQRGKETERERQRQRQRQRQTETDRQTEKRDRDRHRHRHRHRHRERTETEGQRDKTGPSPRECQEDGWPPKLAEVAASAHPTGARPSLSRCAARRARYGRGPSTRRSGRVASRSRSRGSREFWHRPTPPSSAPLPTTAGASAGAASCIYLMPQPPVPGTPPLALSLSAGASSMPQSTIILTRPE